jgi:hypothetical protein
VNGGIDAADSDGDGLLTPADVASLVATVIGSANPDFAARLFHGLDVGAAGRVPRAAAAAFFGALYAE